MSEAQTIIGLLMDRCLIEIKGADAASYLQGLITTDLDVVAAGMMHSGALLSPQGKVLFDFLVGRSAQNNYYIDVAAIAGTSLAKRLSLYKLRAAVEIILHAPVQTLLHYGAAAQKAEYCFIDNRLATEDKIVRSYTPITQNLLPTEERQKWDQIRIDNAIAESNTDFTLGDVFPHDINLDQIGGLSFTKGCYIGQEVVSRMQHRGTARRRLLLAYATGTLPAIGTVIEAGTKPVGMMGSSVINGNQAQGLAIVRLDRVKSALDKGLVISAAGTELRLEIPSRVQFSYPQTMGEDA